MSFLSRYKKATISTEEDKLPTSQATSQPQQGSQPGSQPTSQVGSEPGSQASSQPSSTNNTAEPTSQAGSTPSEPTSQATVTSDGNTDKTSDQVSSQPSSQLSSQLPSQVTSKFKADGNLNSPTIIISAFPGTGKTTYTKDHQDSLDLESSLYSKTLDGQKNPEFPGNYVNMIKWHLLNNNWKYLFISSHEDVREALDKENIKYFLIYPAITRKDEFIKNYTDRGNDSTFINLMKENWEGWITEMSNTPSSYALQPGEFINDKLFLTKLKFLKR